MEGVVICASSHTWTLIFSKVSLPTRLFHPARRLILKNFTILHGFSILHNYLMNWSSTELISIFTIFSTLQQCMAAVARNHSDWSRKHRRCQSLRYCRETSWKMVEKCLRLICSKRKKDVWKIRRRRGKKTLLLTVISCSWYPTTDFNFVATNFKNFQPIRKSLYRLYLFFL